MFKKMKRWRWETKRLIRWAASLTLVVLLVKIVGALKILKVEKPRLRLFFSHLKNVWTNREISLQTKIRILEATVMTVVKYGSEAWGLRKADEDLLDILQRNFLRIALGNRLIDLFSNCRL